MMAGCAARSCSTGCAARRRSTAMPWRRSFAESANWRSIVPTIVELDVNPLLARASGALALDARVSISSSNSPRGASARRFPERRLTRRSNRASWGRLVATSRTEITQQGGDMALMRLTRREPRLAFPGFFPSTAFPTFDDVENRMNRFIERALNEPFAARHSRRPSGGFRQWTSSRHPKSSR